MKNPPAFPRNRFVSAHTQNLLDDPQEGMTLRDYFAAHVGMNDLQRIGKAEDQQELLGEVWDDNWPIRKRVEFNVRMEALLRYAYADAMLAEREKQK